MSFSIGIVAHVDREAMAEELKSAIDADFVSVDMGHLGAGTNHRIVWSVLSDLDTEWTVVLEDDALPVNDFRAQLDAALTVAPADVVSLYLGRQRPPQYQALIANAVAEAHAVNAHWVTSRHLLHAVGVAVKTALVPDMLARLPVLPIDQAIGFWARSRKLQIAYTVPSLVDHLDVSTLIRHPDGKPRTAGRVAWVTGTRMNWTTYSVLL